MSNVNPTDGSTQDSDLDISTPGFALKLRKYHNPILLFVVVLLTTVIYCLEPEIATVILLPIFAIPSLGLLAYVIWFGIVRRGAFTWMRLANQPARLMARGNVEKAEAAFTRALNRAKQFVSSDERRGLMMCELAMFAKNQGRVTESLALYEESVEILSHHQPADYFTALNNYGICFISLKDYHKALKILEKANDLSLQINKLQKNKFAKAPGYIVHYFQFILHLNLAVLCIEIGELAEAEQHLCQAEASLPLLPILIRLYVRDEFVAINALWHFSNGHYSEATNQILKARKPYHATCLWIRARLHIVRKEFENAERLLQKHQSQELKKGTLHRPDLLKEILDLGEAQFGQAKHNDAFASFEEARSIVADFALPADEAWRTSLATWRQRAIELGRTELAASLEAELAVNAVTPNQAITVLEKFRVQPQGE